jgi:hypothetical protein
VPVGVELLRRYSRTDERGSCPRVSDAPEIECNRLAMFWRPIIDMTDSQRAPMRLAMIRPVVDWLADPAPGRVSWFSRIGVAGLRSQVVRHAGLAEYDCRTPADLPEHLRTPAWRQLVDILDRFGELDPYTRALVVFHLAQLSFSYYAARLTGVVPPTGEPGQDHYAYFVARVFLRIPGRAADVMPVLEALATNPHDPSLAVLAAAQGAGQSVRGLGDVRLARRFEELGRRVTTPAGGWQADLARSRFHRAVALLRVAQRDAAGMRDELEAAWRHHGWLAAAAPADEITTMVVDENRRILIESEIKSAYRADEEKTADRLRAWALELSRLDPYCVEARLVVGDGYAAAGDVATAASWYARAGELGTVDGAIGWYRAAQCYDHLGDRDGAIQAMGRCLELDTTAVEPRRYLTALGGSAGTAPAPVGGGTDDH